MIKSICVFCGSSTGNDPAYTKAASELGELLADNGITLVFGAGKCGLMGTLSNSVMANGGKAIGVYPKNVFSSNLINKKITELKVTGSMHERKATMSGLCDAFIALPGGIGTLEELTEILTWSQLGLHKKPIGILNVSGYYNGFLTFLKTSVNEGFLDPQSFERLAVASTPKKVMDLIMQTVESK